MAIFSYADLSVTRASIALSDDIEIGTFFRGTVAEYQGAAHEGFYPVDLNGDGVDEFIAAGFETQYNTPEEFDPTRMHIWGWENGQFADLTNRW